MAHMRLGDLLVSSSVITNEQMEKALGMQKETKERLGDPTICMELTKKDEGCPRQLSDDGSAARSGFDA